MSYRNGDKSRENRLRKARQKMRAKVRDLRSGSEAEKTPAPAKVKK